MDQEEIYQQEISVSILTAASSFKWFVPEIFVHMRANFRPEMPCTECRCILHISLSYIANTINISSAW